MRDYLNAILSFIGSESLTDDEFESIELENTDDQVANYKALLSILEDRESASAVTTRLQNYFLAKGINVSPSASSSNHPNDSNIFVGSSLE